MWDVIDKLIDFIWMLFNTTLFKGTEDEFPIWVAFVVAIFFGILYKMLFGGKSE